MKFDDVQVEKEEGDGAKSPSLGSMCMFPLSTLSHAYIPVNGVPFDLPTTPCYFLLRKKSCLTAELPNQSPFTFSCSSLVGEETLIIYMVLSQVINIGIKIVLIIYILKNMIGLSNLYTDPRIGHHISSNTPSHVSSNRYIYWLLHMEQTKLH